MADGQLFEWEVPERKASEPAPEVVLVPRPPGYHLIANRRGVQGFHRSKIPDADMARHRTVVTYCGITGRRVPDVYPDRIPLCPGCEKEAGK